MKRICYVFCIILLHALQTDYIVSELGTALCDNTTHRIANTIAPHFSHKETVSLQKSNHGFLD